VRRVATLMLAVRAAGRILRTVLGAPDYERYVAHVRAPHPDRAPMSRDDFQRERLDARYSKPGARCC